MCVCVKERKKERKREREKERREREQHTTQEHRYRLGCQQPWTAPAAARCSGQLRTPLAAPASSPAPAYVRNCYSRARHARMHACVHAHVHMLTTFGIFAHIRAYHCSMCDSTSPRVHPPILRPDSLAKSLASAHITRKGVFTERKARVERRSRRVSVSLLKGA